MGRFSNRTTRITNEEIDATVSEFISKLETLRVRYEQYFIGVEKAPPTALRMDVANLMRDLEQVHDTNTALKFRVQTSIQKFTSYSSYWNRVLREIEDGTYKRHLDRVKRHQGAELQQSKKTEKTVQTKEEKERSAALSQGVSDEAEAYLASLGLGSTPKPTVSRTIPTLSSNGPSRPSMDRPAVAQPAHTPVAQTAIPQAPGYHPPIAQPASPNHVSPRPSVIAPATVKPPISQPAAPRPSVIAPAAAKPPMAQHAAPRPSVIAPAAAKPSMTQPAAAKPSVVMPAAQRPQHAAAKPSVVMPAAQRPNTPQPQAPQRPMAARPSVILPAAQRQDINQDATPKNAPSAIRRPVVPPGKTK